MATPIRTNKPVFFGDNGEVLKYGYIYIGQAGQDPRNYPKTVTFKDSAGAEFTAQQPLRTNAEGRIAYTGKAIIAQLEGDYSMLVLDSSGAQVAGGYTPRISNSSGTVEGAPTIAVGTLLSDIKQINVTPGDVVQNTGKVIAEDGLGAQWLAVSATGTPADDDTLIDFDNGTQGTRLNNFVYHKDAVRSGTFILAAPGSLVTTSNANTYRNIWTNISCASFAPDEASAVLVRVYVRAEYASGGQFSIKCSALARKTGSTDSTEKQNTIGMDKQSGTDTNVLEASFVSEAWIPCEPGLPPSFDFYLTVSDPTSTSNTVSPVLDISLIGYNVDLETVA